jgi:glutathione S-transferase
MTTNQPTLKLFTFGAGWGLPTTGPFGLKLEACLRMLELPYERVHENDVRKGPKRKSPWIEDSGLRLGDTELILAHLERSRGVTLDRELDADTRGRAHVLRRMLEEHFHQVFEYELFVYDEGFALVRELMFATLPWPLSQVMPALARRSVHGHLFERGVARHSAAEVEAMGREDVDALVELLGEQPWFFGERPTKADASAFGLLAVAIKLPLPTPVCTYARTKPTLVAFVDRALSCWFPELPIEPPPDAR